MNTITVIIPTYKRPHLLKKAIQSVLDQTYKNLQLFVLDNHSEDETETVVKQFQRNDPRVHYICHESNLGMMKNYEYGFSLIKTLFFHFLSDDDRIFPRFYQEALEAYEKHSDIGFYAASTEIMTQAGQVIYVPNDKWPREGYWGAKEATVCMIGKYPVPTSILFSSSVLQSIVPDYENQLRWDCDFLIRISIQYPIYLSKQKAGIFISHEQSYSRYPDMEAIIVAVERMTNNIKQSCLLDKAVKDKILREIKEEFIHTFRASLLNLLMQNEVIKVKSYFSKLRTMYTLVYHFPSLLIFYGCIRVFPPASFLIHLIKTMKMIVKNTIHHLKKMALLRT